MRKPSLMIIFFTVFIDLIGFGIVLPILPRYADQFGASGFVIGAIIGLYSLMQFFFAPIWGRVSDRVGRRPMILLGTLGSTLSYCLFAVASNLGGETGLWMLAISRAVAGLFGATLSVASAYIADVTPKESRSKGMALIGIAFGLGFILGPAFGAFSAKLFGMGGPGWAAAAICGANFTLACFVLVESRRPDSSPAQGRPRLQQVVHTLRSPKLGVLISLSFLAIFCFTFFESTLPLLLKKTHGYDVSELGYFFAYCGVITLLVQGSIGRLVKRFGEPMLIIVSLAGVAVGFVLIPYAQGLMWMLGALGFYAVFSSLNRAPIMGLISIFSPEDEQGATMGVVQSAGTLARVVGPVIATSLYDFSVALPYFVASAVAVAAGIVACVSLAKERHTIHGMHQAEEL